jgi:hypothetical protein
MIADLLRASNGIRTHSPSICTITLSHHFSGLKRSQIDFVLQTGFEPTVPVFVPLLYHIIFQDFQDRRLTSCFKRDSNPQSQCLMLKPVLFGPRGQCNMAWTITIIKLFFKVITRYQHLRYWEIRTRLLHMD